MHHDHITIDPDQMGGQPCIRGQRFPVITVVAMVEEGMTREEILDDFPSLEAEDIDAALEYHRESDRP